MKIKFSNASLLELVQVINKFSDCTGKLAYVLNKSKRRMLEEAEDFDKVREGLIRKYGEEDENGNIGIKPGTNAYKDFLNEIIPISQEIVEIDVLQLTKEEYDKCDFYSDDVTLRDYELIESIFIASDKKEDDEGEQDKAEE